MAEQSEQGKFPMDAAEFKQHVEQRTTRARARMEKFLADKKVPEEKASQLRAKFDAASAQVNQKVEEVCADGTVTKDEAKAVRDLASSFRPRGKHAKKGAPAKLPLPVHLVLLDA